MLFEIQMVLVWLSQLNHSTPSKESWRWIKKSITKKKFFINRYILGGWNHLNFYSGSGVGHPLDDLCFWISVMIICLSTQITERQGTAMYTVLSTIGRYLGSYRSGCRLSTTPLRRLNFQIRFQHILYLKTSSAP